jgi:very-short-patch-repair endonuclease
MSRGGAQERGPNPPVGQRFGDAEAPARLAPMSRVEAARLGGWATLERHGHTHFREIGKLGFAATVERYGPEFAHDKAAASREAHPERASHDEQRVMAMLAGLGQGDLLAGENVAYRREHKVAPSIHVDFAWPEQYKALEVYGGVHRVLAFDPDRLRAARESAREERIRAAGWELLTVTDRDLTARNWAATSDRLAGFLGLAPEQWLRQEERRA